MYIFGPLTESEAAGAMGAGKYYKTGEGPRETTAWKTEMPRIDNIAKWMGGSMDAFMRDRGGWRECSDNRDAARVVHSHS